MKCRFEHDGDCCNSGATQYMCKCKKPCDTIIPITNADRIRAMSDEELAEFIRDVSYECEDAHWESKCQSCDYPWCSSERTAKWLQQPAEDKP